MSVGKLTFTGNGGIIEGDLGVADIEISQDASLYFSSTDTDYATGSYVETPFTSSHSISFWFKPKDGHPAAEQRLVGFKGDNWAQNLAHIALSTDGKLSYRYSANNNANAAQTNSGVFSDGETEAHAWTHIVATANHTTGGVGGLKLYVNGQEATLGSSSSTNGSTSGITFADWDGDGSTTMYIGTNNADSTVDAGGWFADVKVFTDVLSDTEIKQLSAHINANPITYSIDNLFSWHKCNEGTGTSIVDHEDSGSDYNLTITNPLKASQNWYYNQFKHDIYAGSGSGFSASTTTDGDFNPLKGLTNAKAMSAINCNGSNQKMDVASFDFRSTAPSYTVAFWMKPNTITRSEIQSLVFQDQKFYVRQVEDDIIFAPNYGTEFTASAKLLSHTNWYHIACTFNDSDNAVAVYVNGVLATSGTDSTSNTTGANQMFFGAKNDNTHDYQGMFRDIRLYDYALSEERVESLYGGTYYVQPEHHWLVDGNETPTIEDRGGFQQGDYGGSDQDGTLNGATISNGTLDLDGSSGSSSFKLGDSGGSSYTTEKRIEAYFEAPITMKVSGHWKNHGSFTHNSGTVEFDSSSGYIGDASRIRPTNFHAVTFDNRTHYNRANRAFPYTRIDDSDGLTATDTTFVLDSAVDLSAGEYLRVDNANGAQELVKIVSVTNNTTVVVQRGQLETTAESINNNADIDLMPFSVFESSLTNAGDIRNVGATQGDSNQPLIFFFGTDSASGTLTNNGDFRFDDQANGGSGIVMGTSEMHPFTFAGTDIDWGYDTVYDGTPFIGIGNVDYTVTAAIGGNNAAYVKLTGNAIFDTIGVESGFSLDLNGHRLEASGTFRIESGGALKSTNGGLLVTASDTKILGSAEGMNEKDVNLIASGGTHDWRNGAADGGNSWCRHVLVNGNITHEDQIGSGVGSSLYNPENVIVGKGTLTQTGGPIYLKDITIAQDGVLTNTHSTQGDIGLHGNFTTSGGLLGPSSLSLDRDNTEYAQKAYHADFDFFNSRNAMTAECWFKTAYTGSNHQHIMNLMDTDANPQVMQMFIDYSTGKINARVFTSGTTSTIIGAGDVRDGKWHHVALVYDGDYSASVAPNVAAHKLYVDGKLEAEEFGSGAVYAATSGAGNANFNIGVRRSLEQGFFEGEIDELRLFAAAKTGAQIREDMFTAEGTNLTYFNTLADASTDGLVARYSMNEGTGHDLAATGNSDVNAEIKDYNGGSPVDYNDAWAAAGTFTLNNTELSFQKGSGTQVITMPHAGDVYDLFVGQGSTLQINTLTTTDGLLDITNNLTLHGELTTHTDTANAYARFTSAGKYLYAPQAIDFDGSNDFVDCGTSTDYDFTTDFAISCWARNDLYATSGGSREHLLAKYAGSNGERCYRLYVMGSSLRFGVGYNSGNSSVELGYTLPSSHRLNQWNHYAAIFDSGKMYLYINGVQVAYADNSSTLTSVHVQNSRKVNIGAYQDGSGNTWDGQIADVKFYSDNVLSTTGSSSASTAMVTNAKQINPNEAIYNEEHYHLISHWKLDETSGTTAANSGHGGNAGTHTNSPTKFGNHATNIADLSQVFFDFNGNMNVPALTTKKLGLEINSGADVTLTGDVTLTDEVAVSTTNEFKLNGNTLTVANINMDNSGIIDLEGEASTIAFTGSEGFDNNNDGTLKLGHADLSKGGIGALRYDGRNDHVDLGSTFTLDHDNATLSCWIKLDAPLTPNGDTMLGYSGNVNVGYFKVIANTGQITLNAYPKALTTDTGSGNVISDTNWHHVAATMQGDENGAIYIDGVATALSINTIERNIILDILGARGDNASEHFDGLLNDIRVYNRALTANEVSQLYNSGNPQPDVIDASAIVHWWKGDDATGSTLTDVIGANNGTIDGATWTNAVIKASDGSTDYNFSLSGGSGETVLTCNHAMIDSNAGSIRMDNNQTHTFNDVFFNGSKLRPFSGSSSYQDITLNRCRFGEATGGSNIIRSEGGAIDIVMNNCRLNHGSNSSAFRIGNSHLTLNDCIFEGNNFGSGSAPGFNGTNTILISDQAQIVIVDPKTSYTDVSRDRCIFISPSNGSTSSTHFGIYSALQGVAGFTQDKNVRFEDIYGSRSPFFKISTNNLQCKSLFIGADVTVEVTDDVDFYTGALENNGTLVGSIIDDGSSPFEVPNKLDALQIIDNKIDGELITGVNNLI